jgi:dienelactone hydrolase
VLRLPWSFQPDQQPFARLSWLCTAKPELRDGGRIAAAVIINSSGGVTAHTEHFYARLLADHGVAALVVDSFTPRGVGETDTDQTQVAQSQSAADAVAGFRWLAGQAWADRSRIIVLGMSRGGTAALDVAVETYRSVLQARDVVFAAHVAISPACMSQHENARTTGAPIFFQLSELDDLDPIQPCLEYFERMRAAGNQNLRLAVYPGVYHAKENVGGIARERGDLHTPNCRFYVTAERRLIDRKTGQHVPPGKEWAYIARTCGTAGPFAIGGDVRVKEQAVADLLQFLRDIDIVVDAEARAAVPDCAAILDQMYRRNCVRARAGWSGDMVALGRAYRYPGRIGLDDGAAARLFQLAAQRGQPQAMWELAIMRREGAGMARDVNAGLALLRSAAAAGYPPAMNSLGVWARDGVGQPRDDAEAVKWFRAAADLLDPYALDNLGRMQWQGRGGLAVDHVAAVKLYRTSAFRDDPWGQLHLAEELETGEGAERNTGQALDL